MSQLFWCNMPLVDFFLDPVLSLHLMKHKYPPAIGEPQESRLQRVKENSKEMGLAQPRLDYDVGLIQRDGQRL